MVNGVPCDTQLKPNETTTRLSYFDLCFGSSPAVAAAFRLANFLSSASAADKKS